MVKPRYQFSIRALLLVTLISALVIFFWINRPTGKMIEADDIPPDIVAKVTSDFTEEDSQREALVLIQRLHDRKSGLNVGSSQLCRAILVLANGDLTEFKRLAALPSDPRDIIMKGEAKLGSPKHYFSPTFDDPAYDSEN